MRGIQFITAVGLISELGDLTRFEHPRQLMSWFGITPSEYSSGGSRHQNIHRVEADIRAALPKPETAMPESYWLRQRGVTDIRHASVRQYKKSGKFTPPRH